MEHNQNPMPCFPLFEARGLPTVFSQEVDYYTILSQLYTIVDEVKTAYDGIDAKIVAEVESQVNTAIARYQANVNQQIRELEARLDEEFNAYKGEVDDNIEEFKTLINTQIATLNSDFIEFKNTTTALVNNLRVYVDAQNDLQNRNWQVTIDDINTRIDELVLKYPPILNPTTGLYDSIENVIADIYSAARQNAITAGNFDGLMLTVTEFEDYNMTCTKFDTEGHSILIG